MPELPDITVYCEALERYVGGEVLERIRLGSPFVLRSVEPPLSEAAGRRVESVRRIGKRIVLALDDDLLMVIHLAKRITSENHTLKRTLTDPRLLSGM